MPVRGLIAAIGGAAGDVDDPAADAALLPVQDREPAQFGEAVRLIRIVRSQFATQSSSSRVERVGLEHPGIVDQHVDRAAEPRRARASHKCARARRDRRSRRRCRSRCRGRSTVTSAVGERVGDRGADAAAAAGEEDVGHARALYDARHAGESWRSGRLRPRPAPTKSLGARLQRAEPVVDRAEAAAERVDLAARRVSVSSRIAAIVCDIESAASAVSSTAAVIAVTVCACASIAWRMRVGRCPAPRRRSP